MAAKTEIKLNTAITIDGTEVKALHMREPTVGDQLVMDEGKGSAAQKEVVLFANLCDVTPDDIKKLSLKDYLKVQGAFQGFIE